MTMNHDIFISYSSVDKVAANAICHVLEQNKLRCWIAPRDIPPGAEYGDLIDEAIKHADVVVIIFSETSSTSSWVKGELNIAFEEQKTIIPFRLDSTPLKGQNRVILAHKHWIDAYPDYETKFVDLVNAVKLSLGGSTNDGEVIDESSSYKGVEDKIVGKSDKPKWYKSSNRTIKMFLSVILALIVLFGVVYGYSRVIKDTITNEDDIKVSVKELIIKNRDNVSFSRIKECKQIDDEVRYVLNVKEKIDVCLMDLLRIVERDVKDYSSADGIEDYLYSVKGITAALDDVSNAITSHVAFIQNHLGNVDECNDTLSYSYIKNLRANKDPNLFPAMKKVQEQQLLFKKVQEEYNLVLVDVLKIAGNNDFDVMIKKLQGSEAQYFYKAIAELVLAYYDFEEVRASGIVKAYNSYKY